PWLKVMAPVSGDGMTTQLPCVQRSSAPALRSLAKIAPDGLASSGVTLADTSRRVRCRGVVIEP
ncbi:hypothetical protein, partial [Amycolatopsis thermoflava]|uniref:hypothetical protein n=1 Tax=Amycolatopsis thermoflava TaxID=84480 RepID=UPI00364B429F